MDIKRTVKWIDKTEGRDKFCKSIQYACRFLKYHSEQRGNKQAATKFNALFVAMRDARKLFRLFKTLNEYQKLVELLTKANSMGVNQALGVLTRVFFGLYWIFDNLAILRKIGVISGDSKVMSTKGSTCWLLALIATLILTIRKMLEIKRQCSKLEKSAYEARNDREMQDRRKAYLSTASKQRESVLVLVKTLGDLIPAAQGSQFLEKIGIPASDGLCGFGGLVSAVISCYQLYE